MSNQDSSPILIASVLKPWDDHRMYEKWGGFFKENTTQEIHIYGKTIDTDLDNSFIYHSSLIKKSAFGRIKSYFTFFKLLNKIKPSIVIIGSFELIISCRIYMLFHPKHPRFYYDIIENYRLNIQSQGNYNSLTTKISLLYIQFAEYIASRFIHHFFFSEEIYQSQLHFLNSENSTLIENLYSNSKIIQADKKTNSYLITGTLSQSYGLDIAFKWIRLIKSQNPSTTITILGHLTDSSLIPTDIIELVELKIDNSPISHCQILEAISSSEYLLLPYSWTKSFVGCTPVKLYEAIGLNTKIICSNNHELAQKIKHPLLAFRDEDFVVVNYQTNLSLYIPDTFQQRYTDTLKSLIINKY